MLRTTESVIPRFNRPRATVAVLAATVTLLAGCSINSASKSAKEAISITPVETTLAPSPNTTVATTFDSFDYATTPKREALIATTLQRFGTVVLKESGTPHSAWSPFDTYCSTTANPGGGGWVSQGYKPISGENCEVQHNPQYGGRDMEIDVDVIVGPNGRYSGQVIGAYVNNPSCNAMVLYEGKLPDVMIYRDGKTESTDMATSLSQVQTIDSQAIDCLDSTRP